MIGYSKGLDSVLRMIGLDPKDDNVVHRDVGKNHYDYNKDEKGIIKFEDGYITYPLTYANSMLFNGLKEVSTEVYTIDDANKRAMWLDFLDDFGGRILSDGLDNFEDLFLDPITKEVCEHINLPSDYFELLVYANNLLADNKYNIHTDITGNRYRSNEIVAGYL